MAGTKNDVLVGKNADFTQAGAPNSQTSEANGLATNGQLWIGSTATNVGGTHINVGTLTSPAGTISIGYNSPNITLDLAGGAVAVDSVQVDAFTAPGTNPVAPTAAGLLTITGSQVAAGTIGANVIRTDSLAANTLTVEIQRSTAVASTASVNNGVAHFNSAQFTVDANGFVTSNGSGFIWIDQATSTTVAVNRGYFVTAATTQTLPAAPAQGDVVKIVVADAVTVVVAANAGQTLTIGAVSSAVTATSTASGSTLEFVYRAATTTWFSISTTGTWITT